MVSPLSRPSRCTNEENHERPVSRLFVRPTGKRALPLERTDRVGPDVCDVNGINKINICKWQVLNRGHDGLRSTEVV